jgi:hypothetical protein
MCVLILCKDRALDKDEFDEAWSKNKDGFGYAYHTKEKKIAFKKGLMDRDAAYIEYSLISNNLPHIAHFRLGSPVVPELTHPFLCTEDSELLLEGVTETPLIFHNGVVSGWDKWLMNVFLSLKRIPEGQWSDTRLIAIICKLLGFDALKFIEGKYLVITPEDILMSGKFEDEKDGLVASNTSYIKSKWTGNSYTYNSNAHTNIQNIHNGCARSQQDEFFL